MQIAESTGVQTKLAGAQRYRRTGILNKIRVRNADAHQRLLSLGANALQSLIAHLCKSVVLLEGCRRAAADRERRKRDVRC